MRSRQAKFILPGLPQLSEASVFKCVRGPHQKVSFARTVCAPLDMVPDYTPFGNRICGKIISSIKR